MKSPIIKARYAPLIVLALALSGRARALPVCSSPPLFDLSGSTCSATKQNAACGCSECMLWDASQSMHSEQPHAAFCLVAEQVLPERSKRGGLEHTGRARARPDRASASTIRGAYRALIMGDFIEECCGEQSGGQSAVHAGFTHGSHASRLDLWSVAGFWRETETLRSTLYTPRAK